MAKKKEMTFSDEIQAACLSLLNEMKTEGLLTVKARETASGLIQIVVTVMMLRDACRRFMDAHAAAIISPVDGGTVQCECGACVEGRKAVAAFTSLLGGA